MGPSSMHLKRLSCTNINDPQKKNKKKFNLSDLKIDFKNSSERSRSSWRPGCYGIVREQYGLSTPRVYRWLEQVSRSFEAIRSLMSPSQSYIKSRIWNAGTAAFSTIDNFACNRRWRFVIYTWRWKNLVLYNAVFLKYVHRSSRPYPYRLRNSA